MPVLSFYLGKLNVALNKDVLTFLRFNECYVMLCYVMLCYVMLCYVINRFQYLNSEQHYSKGFFRNSWKCSPVCHK